MLAIPGDPPQGDGWAVEFTWDGERAVVVVADERLRAWSRNGNDVTACHPNWPRWPVYGRRPAAGCPARRRPAAAVERRHTMSGVVRRGLALSGADLVATRHDLVGRVA